MAKCKIKVNEGTWTVKVVTSRQMKDEREDGDDCAGLCIAVDKSILIEEHNIDLNTISHELMHAYISDLHLSDTEEMTNSDLEEIFCSLFADKGELIINKSKKLTKNLQKKYAKELENE
jgi:hypothetical protein